MRTTCDYWLSHCWSKSKLKCWSWRRLLLNLGGKHTYIYYLYKRLNDSQISAYVFILTCNILFVNSSLYSSDAFSVQMFWLWLSIHFIYFFTTSSSSRRRTVCVQIRFYIFIKKIVNVIQCRFRRDRFLSSSRFLKQHFVVCLLVIILHSSVVWLLTHKLRKDDLWMNLCCKIYT